MIDYGFGVILGPLQFGNLEFYRTERNLPEIRRWCRQRHLISLDDQEDWYERQRLDPTIQMFEVIAPGGILAGVCGLTDIDHINQRAEFSLWIATHEQGQGLGEAALKTLCSYGFMELNLNMIWGETVGVNPGAQMFERCGFLQTGYRPSFYFKEGEWKDSYIYCLLRDSFS